MFGTLRRDSMSNDIVFVNDDVVSSSHHTACNKCRAEKLRCSGEKTGCSRCKTSKTTCVYTKNPRGEAARCQRQRRSRSDMARVSEDTRGQRGALSQQQEQARPLDSPFSRGMQSSQFSGDRNEGNPRNSPTPSRSTAQPNNDGFLPPTPPSLEPGLDADFLMSEFVHGILPQYESSSMEDGEDNLEFGLGPFSGMLQDGTLPLDDSYRSSQKNKTYHDICQSNERSEAHSVAKTLATSRSSASQPPSTMTTRLSESMATDPPFYQHSPTGSPSTPHVPCFHENTFHCNQEFPTPTSVSLRKQKSSISSIPTLENCKCLQEIGTLLSDLEHHQSRASTASLDSVLFYHKSALSQLSALVSCQNCRARSEFLVLLSVVCEKTTTLCETMLAQRANGASLSPKSGQSIETGETSEIVGSGAFSTAKKTFLGDYEVNSVSEWQLLMKALFSLQLSRLWR